MKRNKLSEEVSPYLLQHANNPVHWLPWGREALDLAQQQDKLIIVSVGYFSCHWCHVMERESFEDDEVAELMNKSFVSIKVDREERPDIDNVYMDALHLMGQQGGWPLNCICLPDGTPVFGGTYFPKRNWMQILDQVSAAYKTDRSKVLEYGQKMLATTDEIAAATSRSVGGKISVADLDEMFCNWAKSFDMEFGGTSGAPKFPKPSTFLFLLRYYYFSKNSAAKDFVEVSLDRIAAGGIYDHVGGGFSRYSVDSQWKVPHFEKMLYDNAQLISAYSEAYRLFKKEEYRNVVYKTISFLQREMLDATGGYYSAIDADSEGVEGKFYVWTWEELEHLLGSDLDLFAAYYNISPSGNWEYGNNVLFRRLDTGSLAEDFNISKEELIDTIDGMLTKLFEYREKRIRPATDTKIITSWNALLLSAFCDAYKAFSDKIFLDQALLLASYFSDKGIDTPGQVNRLQLKQDNYLPGFLDDYALLTKAYTDLYQCTFNEEWLLKARRIADLALDNFYDSESGLFNYTSKSSEKLFSGKQETVDNVIPSSNSIMANVLYVLAVYFDKPTWLELSTSMLNKVSKEVITHGDFFSNWAMLAAQKLYSWPEMVISGPDVSGYAAEYYRQFHYATVAGSRKNSMLPLLENRFSPDQTRVYVCRNKTCNLPVETINEALLQLQQMAI